MTKNKNNDKVFNITKEKKDFVMLKKIMFALLLSFSNACSAPVDDLAKTLYHEACGEGEIGIRAVASIIINRAEQKGKITPDALSSVVKQKFQFSCWNGKKDLKTGKGKSWEICMKVAKEMSEGCFNKTHGYTHYYAFKKCKPRWSNGRKKMIIGNHAFLNP
ncbi:MAG: cell wall hydrolase [Candidatus Methanomethylophilaceae archaeon]